jgi:hypothetical protein
MLGALGQRPPRSTSPQGFAKALHLDGPTLPKLQTGTPANTADDNAYFTLGAASIAGQSQHLITGGRSERG